MYALLLLRILLKESPIQGIPADKLQNRNFTIYRQNSRYGEMDTLLFLHNNLCGDQSLIIAMKSMDAADITTQHDNFFIFLFFY